MDCLVNAAGVAAPQGGLMAGSTASWVEMVSTNVLGAAMVTREAVQDMARRGAWGHVVNVSCLEGHAAAAGGGGGGAGAGGGFYAATKHALHAMTDGLRQEVSRGAGVGEAYHGGDACGWCLCVGAARLSRLCAGLRGSLELLGGLHELRP